MKYFLLVPLLFFTACTLYESSSSQTTSPTTKTYVEVFTLAPVVNALVTDANNQVASYDTTKHQYYFEKSVTYPISAQAISTTYVDIDYDNNETANDLKPSTFFSSHALKSFCNSITLLSAAYYEQNLSDSNITTNDYANDIFQRFNINVCDSIMDNSNNAKVLFGAYNYTLDTNASFTLTDIEPDVSKVEDFFAFYLNNFNLDEDKIKYYSSYNALTRLDLLEVQRVDTIHKPELSTILRPKLPFIKNSSGVDVFDILPYGSDIYLAAGHDELSKVDTNLQNQVFENNVSLVSFGSRFYKQNYQATDCLFLANSKIGLSTYKIDTSGFTKITNLDKYINSSGSLVHFSNSAITNTTGYVSVNENKRLLGISTKEKGFYLLNIKDTFTQCTPNTTIYNGATINDIRESRDFILNEAGGYSVDATFRDDGTYLYVAHKDNGIVGYKTDILDVNEVNSSKKIFTLQENAQAYNLQLFNNDNELLVTTDKGLQIYDVGSAVYNLQYVSKYQTHGAQVDYFQDIDVYGDFVFLTDGYQGVKVLKLSNSFEPMLCGVEYFAPNNNSYELAKTTSVKYDNGYLYVGIASYGIVKFKLDDILFQHCR